MRSWFLGAGLVMFMVTGCSSDGPSARTVYSVTIHGGDDQTAPAGGELPQPLAVTVTDPANAPVPGVAVRFRVATGTGATLSDELATSGLDGVARVTARLGPTMGPYEFIGYISGREDQGVPFSAEATAPPTLTGAAPDNFSAGDTITLRGTGFSESTAGNEAFVAGVTARIIAGNSDTLAIVIPPCVAPGSVPITVRVGSVTTNSLTRTYATTGTVIQLAELQGVTVSGAEVGRCLKLAAGGARYLLVPNFASADTGPVSIGYTIGSTASAPPPPLSSLALVADGQPEGPQQRLDRWLRQQEHLRAPGAQAGAQLLQSEMRPLEALTLNSSRNFRVLIDVTPPTYEWTTVSARLKHIGQNILLYVDAQSPSGGFTDDQLTNLGKHFDETLYGIAVGAFGTASDVDNNGRVIVLMSPEINALTERAECSLGFITGYFLSLDLGPYENSNRAEVFYTLVPDPNEEFGCRHPVSNVQRYAASTFIHELQHMISYNQHSIVRNASDEDLWLNEGLSHMAEELASRHYEDRCPPPACRTSPTQVLPDSAGPFLIPNLHNAYDFMTSTSAASVTTFTGVGRLPERGAAWLFLRWLGDQKGDQIFGRLVQTSKTSVRNIEDKAGESFASLLGDFSIAMYTDSLPGVPRTSIPQRYRFTSRNLRFLFSRLHASSPSSFPQEFPLFPQTLTPGSTAGSTAFAGSMAFWDLLSPETASQIAIQFAPTSGAQFPSALQAQIGVFRLP